jgi:hypothetical protein
MRLAPSTRLLLPLFVAGCAAGSYEVKRPPPRPFDVVVVPGCPCEDDGSLSRCQMERAAWAHVIWERGWARNFIVSGAAVHSPYVEAEAIAEAMAALGVPGERIYLEPEALHTDENMYDSLQIARLLGLRSVAVTGEWSGPSGSCEMMASWGQPCSALPADFDLLKPRLEAAHKLLDPLRARRVASFQALADREAKRATATGRPPRPASWLLYMSLGLLRAQGTPWIPFGVAQPKVETWAQHLGPAARAGHTEPR